MPICHTFFNYACDKPPVTLSVILRPLGEGVCHIYTDHHRFRTQRDLDFVDPNLLIDFAACKLSPLS